MRIYAHTPTAIAAALLVLGLLPACDLLEESPQDFITPKNFYESEDDALAAVNAVYETLTLSGLYRQAIWFYGAATDDVVPRPGDSPDITQADRHTYTTRHEFTAGFWEDSYELIKRANAVTGNVPAIEMEGALKNRLLGEARFLRALAYFNLVRIFGDVPLVLKEPESLENLDVSRASVEEVYAQIIKDLRSAIDVLPASYPTNEKGRATAGAARALLGKVYLTREAWSKAAAELENVVKSGQYALYEDFKDVFDVTKENGEESIFAVQFAGEGSRAEGTPITLYCLPLDGPVPGGPSWGVIFPTQDLIESYELDDDRFEVTFWTEWVTPSGDTIPFERGVAWIYEGHHFRKYFDEDVNIPRGGDNPNDFPVLRYAGVLLMYAEALNEMSGGPTPTAYDAINRVRERAGLEPLEPGLSQAAFREAVRKERRHELALEGKRWFDLKRYGMDYLRQRIKDAQDIVVPKYHALWPIPQREIDVNPKLTQNPGY